MAESPATERIFKALVLPTASLKVVVEVLPVANLKVYGVLLTLSTVELKVTFPALPVPLINVVSTAKVTAPV